MKSVVSAILIAVVSADLEEKLSDLVNHQGDFKEFTAGYDPSLYKFGNACATGTDDDCAIETAFCAAAENCRWSWLTDDTPSGSSAKCRCDGITSPIDPADYDYGDAC